MRNWQAGTAQEYSKVALGLDVRSIHGPAGCGTSSGCDGYGELFSGDPVSGSFYPALVRRYKETRRSHPLSRNGRVSDGIGQERRILEGLKMRADYILDTSQLLTRDLRQEIEKILYSSRNTATCL